MKRWLYDCMIGDATLFHRADIVEASWQIIDPILEAWRRSGRDHLAQYRAGSWGPPKLTRCSTAMDARGTSRAFNLRLATQRHSSPYFRIRL